MDFSFLVSLILLAATALVAVPILIFFSEVAAAAFLSRKEERPETPVRRRTAVLVPAHNESAGIIPTLNDLKAQLLPGDRLLVVADNCSDDTGEMAALTGAEVIVRSDVDRRGKSYALDYGLKHLAADPTDVVVVIDADCRVHAGAIAALSDACMRTGRPVQALDLMQAPARPTSRQLVAEFAWRVKNWVRPLGLRAVGLPCQLMGTGMAFPWAVIAPVKVADDLVEDVRLGLGLAALGHAPLFCTNALVTSEFPASVAATDTQRRRWEQGHLSAIVTLVPGTLASAIRRRNPALLAMSLDLLVPPVSLLVLAAGALWFVAALAAMIGMSPWPLLISTIGVALLFTAVLLAWLDFGTDLLPVNALGTVATYALKKLPLYRDFVSGRTAKEWVRTDRDVP